MLSKNEFNLVKITSILSYLLVLGFGGSFGSVIDRNYRCTLNDFFRLGNSCYFLSSESATWQEAHFRCRDKGAQLAVLASHFEDSSLRDYLETQEYAQVGRWIGGMWAKKWIWAAQGSEIENSQSFASPDEFKSQNPEQWMCLYMNPRERYLWNSENCMREMRYICEAPLAKAQDTTVEEDQSVEEDEAPIRSTVVEEPFDSASSFFDSHEEE